MTQPRRPSGISGEARFWQWVYDTLTEPKSLSNQFITDYTTRGVLRRPIPQQNTGASEIEGDFVYTFTFKESPQVATVENGFCYNATAAEIAAYSAGTDPLLVPSTNQTLLQNPDQATLANSRVYSIKNRFMRFQMTATKYAAPNLDRPTNLGPEWDLGPFLFVKLIEMPFKASSGALAGGWVRSEMEYNAAVSSEGFHVYNVITGGRKNYLVIPPAKLLGIVSNTIASVNAPSFGNAYPIIIRRRDEWGGAWLPNTMLGAGLVFSEQVSTCPVFEEAPTGDDGLGIFPDRHWTTNEGFLAPSGASGTRPPYMDLNAAEEGLMTEALFVRGRYQHTFNAQTPPLDGDQITFNEITWTWRETVSDPDHELLCLAYDPESAEEIGDAYANALLKFREMFIHINSVAGYETFRRRFKRVESDAQTVFIQSEDGAFTITITGNWATLSPKRSYGHEREWRPTPAATKVLCINPRGAASNQVETTVDRNDWLRISLRAPFDQTIEMPAFESPFMVQVFYQPALRLGDPLQFPDGSTNPLGLGPGEEFGFTFTATPQRTVDG